MEEGWIKSTDPRTGRVFFANHLTRQTQWEPPAGWVDGAEEQQQGGLRHRDGAPE